ncbi:MAG: hypothetical protein KF832_00275 [Caldilineaceae bacterium]|nr:hypothetical protein [Caldilineaceae bacterium]
MDVLQKLISGEWGEAPHLLDYRVELLTNMMVERVTWDPNAPTHWVNGKTVAEPGYIWVRFWLLEQAIVLEKYFDAQQQVIGYHLPISMPIQHRGNQLVAALLHLSLWLTPDGRVTVLHEARFDEATATGELAPVETEHAEYQIRELTTGLARGNFPPAFVRNFALQ